MEPYQWQGKCPYEPCKAGILMNCSRQSGKSNVRLYHRAAPVRILAGFSRLLVSPSLRKSGELLKIVTGYLARLPDWSTGGREQDVFPVYPTAAGAYQLPGTEQTIRGYGGVNLIVVDELRGSTDALITGLTPMLAVSGGRLLD